MEEPILINTDDELIAIPEAISNNHQFVIFKLKEYSFKKQLFNPRKLEYTSIFKFPCLIEAFLINLQVYVSHDKKINNS